MQFGQRLVCAFSPVTSASAEETITSWAWLSFLFLKECARGCGFGGISCLLSSLANILLFICLLKVAQIIPYLFRFLFIARFFFWDYTYTVSHPYCSQWISGSFHCIDWDTIKITGCYEILLHGSDQVSHILMDRIDSSCYVSSAPTPAPGLAWFITGAYFMTPPVIWKFLVLICSRIVRTCFSCQLWVGNWLSL